MNYTGPATGGHYVHSTAISSSGYMQDHMSYKTSSCAPTDYVYISRAGIQQYHTGK
jgi:hypothetical protein